MSKINFNRVDFEAFQLTCRTARGQLRWPMSNPVEFDGIKWFNDGLMELLEGGK